MILTTSRIIEVCLLTVKGGMNALFVSMEIKIVQSYRYTYSWV